MDRRHDSLVSDLGDPARSLGDSTDDLGDLAGLQILPGRNTLWGKGQVDVVAVQRVPGPFDRGENDIFCGAGIRSRLERDQLPGPDDSFDRRRSRLDEGEVWLTVPP
jgi:hypothetical protein